MKCRAFRPLTNITFFLALVVSLCASVEGRTVYSTHGQSFSWNGYRVLNSQWGRSSATNPDWYQRIVLEDNNTVTFEYNWAGPTSQVKGYPVVMAGWHYGNPGGWMTPSGQKGFPSQIGANRSYNISCNVSHTNAGPTSATADGSAQTSMLSESNSALN